MNKKIISTLIIMSCLILLPSISAYESFEDIPSSLQLKCGESYSETFNFNESVNYEMGSSDYLVNYQLSITKTSANYLQINLFPKPNYQCVQGQSTFTFTVNDINYNLGLNITEDVWDLGEQTLSDGDNVEVGGLINFGVVTTDNNQIRYVLSGCNNNRDDFLQKDGSIEVMCEGESIKFTLENSFASPFSFSKIRIYSSEPAFNVIIGEREQQINESECILGLDTLGVKIKRGNLMAITTLNSNTGKYESSVIVRVLDQAGELEPLSGTSDNTGYFGQRLNDEYEQDLVVKLEKEGCEPYTRVLFFDRSYNDYLQDKEDEENQKTLQLILENSELKIIKGIVTNRMNESVESVIVKITNPSGVSKEVLSNENGFFEHEAEEFGIFKLQAGKSDYTSSELINYTLKSHDYFVKRFVEDKVKNEFKVNDIIVFKLYDEEDNILPMNFDAEIDGNIIKFIDGISEDYKFSKETNLKIPNFNGYEEQIITLKKAKNKNMIYWIVGIVVLLGLFIVATSSSKKEEGADKMQIQLNPQS